VPKKYKTLNVVQDLGAGHNCITHKEVPDETFRASYCYAMEHMIERYKALNRVLRSLHATVMEIIDAYNYDGKGFVTSSLTNMMGRLLSDLERFWPEDLDGSKIREIGQLISNNDSDSYWSIVKVLIPALENSVDDYFSSQP
jgi:hypothetical protein